MNFGVILAGGVGARMGGSLPKQFIEICKKPIIIYTIEKMLPVFDRLYIGIHPDYRDYLLNIIQTFNISTDKITIVNGGKERINSIENVVNAIWENRSEDEDVVVIHDAVRPFVTEELLRNSILTAREYGACVATVPATDTMYVLDEHENIVGFPDRKTIFNGQAPDSFKLNIIKKALDTLTENERKTITGTVQICAAKGYKIKAIKGDYKNIKITTESDIAIAESIIKGNS